MSLNLSSKAISDRSIESASICLFCYSETYHFDAFNYISEVDMRRIKQLTFSEEINWVNASEIPLDEPNHSGQHKRRSRWTKITSKTVCNIHSTRPSNRTAAFDFQHRVRWASKKKNKTSTSINKLNFYEFTTNKYEKNKWPVHRHSNLIDIRSTIRSTSVIR